MIKSGCLGDAITSATYPDSKTKTPRISGKAPSFAPNSTYSVVKRESSCQTMPAKTQRAEPIKVGDVWEKRRALFSKKLHDHLKKAAAKSRAPPSWTVLRGEERRMNIRHIMQKLERSNNVNPYSVEQFESLKKAIEEHGQLGETAAAAVSPTRSTGSPLDRVSDFIPATHTASHSGNADQFWDIQPVIFHFGRNYGNRVFFDSARHPIYGHPKYTLYRDMMTGPAGQNTEVQGLRYLSDDVMQLWSLEDILNYFSKEQHF